MTDQKEETNEEEIETEGSEKQVITSPHEEELYVDADTLATFLRDLSDQIEEGDKFTISTEEWELPFTFERTQIEIEVDRGYHELEIEIEFDEARSGDISVE